MERVWWSPLGGLARCDAVYTLAIPWGGDGITGTLKKLFIQLDRFGYGKQTTETFRF